MELYVARDKNGGLFLYNIKPSRDETTWYAPKHYIIIDSNLFPEITWESEPVKANLKLEKI